MALETGNYLYDLVATNPTSTDPKSQGDDHLRLLKTALKNCFPGFTGPVVVAGVDAGAANAYVLTPATALVAYVVNTMVVFKVTNANTGASTMNISGLGVRSIKTIDGVALSSGDLPAGQYVAMVDNGTEYRLVGITKNYVDQLAFSAALPAISLGLLGSSDGLTAGFSKNFTGFAVNTARATVASHATTADIWGAAGNEIDFTGTATITDFPDAPIAGAKRVLHCAGACVFTHNANIFVPGSANFTAAAGDIVTIHAITVSTFRIEITKASGLPTVNPSPTAAQGASWVLLSTVTASASSTIDIETTLDGTYDNYVLKISGLRPSNTSSLINCRFKIGGSYQSTADYSWWRQTGPSNSGTYSASNIDGGTLITLIGDTDSNSATSTDLTLSISLPANTLFTKKILWDGVTVKTGTPKLARFSGVGSYIGAVTALTGLRFYPDAGTLAEGTFRLYGIKNS